MHTLRRTGTISPADLSASLRDYIIVDVRPLSEWQLGHLPGSACIDPTQLETSWVDPDPRLPVAVVADDTRSAETAAAEFRTRGRDAVVLEGGYQAWIAARGCVVHSHTDLR